jgi:3-dehydroquinate synthase
VIGSGTLGELSSHLTALTPSRTAAVVTNPTVGRLYLSQALTALRGGGFDAVAIEIPDGEEHKNLAWLTFVYDRLVEARLERTSPVVALGGGVIGDLAGFAAATFLRGVPFVQVPTTLLSQVDSSVGGKTGINHPAGKNLIGAFYQPRLVLIDIDTLATLPRREFLAGLAEVIKYGIILDADLFALVEQRLDAVLSLNDQLLGRIVHRCCALKAMVVQRDEREADYRSILNFGHTIGHAVERLTEYRRYLHGEAIAMGMTLAARISYFRKHCKQEIAHRIERLLQQAGLPVELPPDIRATELKQAVESDKKVASGKVKFVCIEGLGRPCFEYLTSREIADLATR